MRDKPKSGFTLRTAREHGGYNMLYLSVFYDYDNTSFSNDKRAQLKYQANHDSPFEFYGGRLEIECESLVGLQDINNLLRRIFRPKKPAEAGAWWEDNFNFHSTPVEVLKKLWGTLPQVVNDQRHSKYVLVKDVQPKSFHAWRDDWKKVEYDGDSCTVGCIAENADEAQRLLTIEFCNRTSEYYVKRFNKWAAAGRPVRRLGDDGYGYGYPEFEKVEDLLKKIEEARLARETAAAKAAAEAQNGEVAA